MIKLFTGFVTVLYQIKKYIFGWAGPPVPRGP